MDGVEGHHPTLQGLPIVSARQTPQITTGNITEIINSEKIMKRVFFCIYNSCFIVSLAAYYH